MTFLTAIGRFAAAVLRTVLIGLVMVYRYAVSPVLHMVAPGSGCRFQPSCSEYALQALRTHGPLAGTWLAAKRIARCHPWGGHGYDPVPDCCSCANRKDSQHPSLLGSASADSSHKQAHS